MATKVTWTFSTIFTQSSESLLQKERKRLLQLALNLASALPADGQPSAFGSIPAEESRVDGFWYKIYCPNAESLLLLKLLLLRDSNTTLEVANLSVDPIIIYSPPHGASNLASLFVYAHLWVDETARFFCLGYMQGSAMELIIQQRRDTWHAVGERSGRLCATDLQQRLEDARVEQLKATYAGSPSASTTIPFPYDGQVTDIKHYNFAKDIELPRLSGSTAITALFSGLRVQNLRATRQVAMQLGDVAALMHLRVRPHYGVLGVGDIIHTSNGNYAILYRPPALLASNRRDGSSVMNRRVMIMQNTAARKVSIWSGDPVQAPRAARSVSIWSGDPVQAPRAAASDADVVFLTRSFSLFGL